VEDIAYNLIRSNRKTLALHLTHEGIEVRAPLSCPISEIEAFIHSKRDWLIKKIAIMRKQIAEQNAYVLDYGSKILYRGKRYPIVASKQFGFEEKFLIPPGLPEEGIRHCCVHIYKYLAKIRFTARVTYFADIMRVNPTAVKVNSARRRWGSCSGKKSINFSWRLVMASDRVIDYVVVHELAHLLQMDHSARFWGIVEAVIPDYVDRRTELKEYAKVFAIEGWS